jgi:hypothetical protein
MKRLLRLFGKLLSVDLAEDGFIRRARNDDADGETYFPVRVYIGNVSWENRFRVNLYNDGVALYICKDDHEWFVKYLNISVSGEHQRPFELIAKDGKKIKVSFGEEYVDENVKKHL